MEYLFVFRNYIKHLIKSKSKFKIHSPFVYDLITRVFKSKIPFTASEKISKQRKILCLNNTMLATSQYSTDLQFESKKWIDKSSFNSVKKIARSAMMRKKYENLLYNLISQLNPKILVEIGTSLGMTTIIMALAAPQGKLYTFESCPDIASFAQNQFDLLGFKNITLKWDKFSKTIIKTLDNVKRVDFVFFDGNQSEKAIIDYFNKFLPYKTNETIFVFSRIYRSKEMKRVWDKIKNHPETIVTIDLFQLGIVFFKKELSQQHFIYKF